MDSTSTSVYRYYDRHNMLIYVGITRRRTARNQEHNSAAGWWPFVVRQEVDHLATRREAEVHEKDLIVTYRPPFNVQHNPDHAGVREAYLAWASTDASDQDPMTLFRQLGRRLPVTVETQTDSLMRMILRTKLGHSAIATRLTMPTPSVQVLSGNGVIGSANKLEVSGAFAIISAGMRSSRLYRVLEGALKLKVATIKPVSFRIENVAVEVDKESMRLGPTAHRPSQ